MSQATDWGAEPPLADIWQVFWRPVEDFPIWARLAQRREYVRGMGGVVSGMCVARSGALWHTLAHSVSVISQRAKKPWSPELYLTDGGELNFVCGLAAKGKDR